MPLAAGTRLGVFAILAPLGKGGDGLVANGPYAVNTPSSASRPTSLRNSTRRGQFRVRGSNSRTSGAPPVALAGSLEPEANSERGQEGDAALVLSFPKDRLAGDGIEADAVVDLGRVHTIEDVDRF